MRVRVFTGTGTGKVNFTHGLPVPFTTRGSAKVVARDGGSKRGLYEEVETEIAVEGGVVDDNEVIVAVRDSYMEIAVRHALEMQNSTLRGARRR